MRILIVGASGRTGKVMLEQALERGHEVTAFVRTPSKLREYAAPVKVVKGDVYAEDSLFEAMAGQDAVMAVFGGRVKQTGPVRTTGVRNILTAMEQHGTSRLIVLSAFGVGDTRDRGPYSRLIWKLIPAELEDLEGQEEAVRNSRVDWVLVRPTILTNGRLTKQYQVGEDLTVGLFPRISRADVAHFMLDQLESDEWLHRTPGITV